MIPVLLQSNRQAYAYAKQEQDRVVPHGKQWHQFQNIKSLALQADHSVTTLMAKLNAFMDNTELTASQRYIYRRVFYGLLAGFVWQEAQDTGKAIAVVLMDEYQHNTVKGLEKDELYPSYTVYSSLSNTYTCVYLMPEPSILKQAYIEDIIFGSIIYYRNGVLLGQKPPTTCEEYDELMS